MSKQVRSMNKRINSSNSKQKLLSPLPRLQLIYVHLLLRESETPNLHPSAKSQKSQHVLETAVWTGSVDFFFKAEAGQRQNV